MTRGMWAVRGMRDAATGPFPALRARLTAGLVLAISAAAGPAGAQEVASSLDARDGRVGVRLAMDPELEICERGIRRGPDSWMQWNGYRSEGPGRCSRGTALAVFELRDGEARGMELEPWTGSVPAGVRDGGALAGDEAADLLVAASREMAARDDGGVAMMTAVHLDGPPVWPALLDLARDRTLPERGRKSALFWLGQEAADAVTAGILEVAEDESEDQDIRDAAVFALSQRPDDEAVPALIELARTARHGKTRRSAMFWLAQSDDPRVTSFFEEVLLGGSSGAP